MRIAIKMSILNWIRERETEGQYTFSVKEAQSAFPSMSSGILQNELFRLSGHREITAVHKGFYVRIPARYRNWEFLPAYFYIDQLMEYLKKPYYISLLTAGALHGAAHQAPQRFCVFTTLPAAKTSERINPIIAWNYRRIIPESLLLKKQSETGEIRYSNAELTAVDLVQYSHCIGGMSRAATVLAELLECTDFKNADESLFKIGTVSAFQRLGYIMEDVLNDSKQAEELYERLHNARLQFRWSPLSKQIRHGIIYDQNSRWHIHVNVIPEVDDL